jgi:hypothetical protein
LSFVPDPRRLPRELSVASSGHPGLGCKYPIWQIKVYHSLPNNVDKTPFLAFISTQAYSSYRTYSISNTFVMATRTKHRCHSCSRNFLDVNELLKHMTIARHWDGGKYKCLLCGRSFVSETALEQHQQALKHFSITCETCPKAFSTQESCEEHMRLRRHYTSYCYPCERRFADNYSLGQVSCAGVLPLVQCIALPVPPNKANSETASKSCP